MKYELGEKIKPQKSVISPEWTINNVTGGIQLQNFFNNGLYKCRCDAQTHM